MNKTVEDIAIIIYYQMDIEIDWGDAVRIAENLYDHGYGLRGEGEQ